jgi:hypothetical protein
MDFGDIVKLIVDRWEQVPEANGIEMSPGRAEITEDGQESEQPLFHAMKKLLAVKSLWDMKVAAMTAADASEGASGLVPEEHGAAGGAWGPGMHIMDSLEFGPMNMEMLDDNWIRDMLGGGFDFNP